MMDKQLISQIHVYNVNLDISLLILVNIVSNFQLS